MTTEEMIREAVPDVEFDVFVKRRIRRVQTGDILFGFIPSDSNIITVYQTKFDPKKNSSSMYLLKSLIDRNPQGTWFRILKNWNIEVWPAEKVKTTVSKLFEKYIYDRNIDMRNFIDELRKNEQQKERQEMLEARKGFYLVK